MRECKASGDGFEILRSAGQLGSEAPVELHFGLHIARALLLLAVTMA